jgi:hypothetical protein
MPIENEDKMIGSLPDILENVDDLYEGNLKYYFKVFMERAKNLNNPYHNFRHIGHFVWLCWEALKFYKRTEIVISKRDARDLLVVGMNHDFDHTGTVGPDWINIKRAVAGLEDCCHPDDRPYLKGMVSLLCATEYPHNTSIEVGLLVQIMWDADLAQVFDPAWFQEVILGLAAEQGKSPLEMLEAQESFLLNLKFHTQWAQERFNTEVIKSKIIEVQRLLAILQ